jgi:resuscitation-promoting factor RpfB
MSQQPRRPLRLAARGAVLLVMAVGSVGYSLADKTVTITADGQTRTVHTFAGDVASALHRAGVVLGSHDVVEPAMRVALHDGSHIVIERGRRLALTVDGSPRTVWVTQPDLADAADALGMHLEGAYLSTSRSQAIPVSGLALTVRMPQRIALTVGGVLTSVTTTEPSIAQLLADQGVQLSPFDIVSTPLSAYPVNGESVRVTRVTHTQWLQRTKLAVPTLRVPDRKMALGRVKLAHGGRAGVHYRLWGIVSDDGQVVRQRLLQESTLAPKAKVIRYGTRPRKVQVEAASLSTAKTTSKTTSTTASLPARTIRSATATVSKPTPKPVVHAAVPKTTRGAGLNWAALARCESGGNPRAVDGAYYGLYQFSLGTWRAVGGRGKPSDASSAEQTYRAKLLYAQQGSSPWPACGHYL